jgi:hypothetical protein
MRSVRPILLLAALFVLFLTVSPAAANGSCATAEVTERFVLPDGSEHGPGKITLCPDQNSPVQAMHVGYVDRSQIGLFLSYRGRSEAPVETRPYMMFARDERGRLHLYGFATPVADGMETYLFDEFPSRRVA